MTETAWTHLTAPERMLLLAGLRLLRHGRHLDASEIDALTAKITSAEPHPDITVGVYGGKFNGR